SPDSRRRPGAGRSSRTSRPGPGQLAGPAAVDLGIDRRGQLTPVPQPLPDLRQRRPGAQQVTGHGVTQAVRPDPGDSGTPARARDDAADAIGGTAPPAA